MESRHRGDRQNQAFWNSQYLLCYSLWRFRAVPWKSNHAFLQSVCICWRAYIPLTTWSRKSCRSHISSAYPLSPSSPTLKTLLGCRVTGSSSWRSAVSLALRAPEICINCDYPDLSGTDPTLQVLRNPSADLLRLQNERGSTELPFLVAALQGNQPAHHSTPQTTSSNRLQAGLTFKNKRYNPTLSGKRRKLVQRYVRHQVNEEVPF